MKWKKFLYKDKEYTVVLTNHDVCLAYPTDSEYTTRDSKWFSKEYVESNLCEEPDD